MATSIIVNLPINLNDMFEKVQLAAFGYELAPRCSPFVRKTTARRRDDPIPQEKAEPVPSTSRATGNQPTGCKTDEKTDENGSLMEILQNIFEGKNDIDTVSGEEGFNVTLDVQDFKRHELSVKVVDGSIVVEGITDVNHDELFSRNFKRIYAIPEGCDSDKTFSLLLPEGILTVGVPRRERNSQITEPTSN